MPDGKTFREHLQVAAGAGQEVPELEVHDPPECAAELLATFWQLRRAAGSNGMTANSITFGEIESWQNLTGAALTAWEVETIQQLDAVAIDTMRKAEGNGNNGR